MKIRKFLIFATLLTTIVALIGLFTACNNENDKTVAVTGIDLDQETLELNVGDTATLIPTVIPENATNKQVKWTITDDSDECISIDNGVITANDAGSGTIIVTTVDGGKRAECTYKVNETKGELVTTVNYVWSEDDHKTELKVYDNKMLELTGLASTAVGLQDFGTFMCKYTIDDNEIVLDKNAKVVILYINEYNAKANVYKIDSGKMLLRVTFDANNFTCLMGEFEFSKEYAAVMGFEFDELYPFHAVENVTFSQTEMSVEGGTQINLGELLTVSPSNATLRNEVAVSQTTLEGKNVTSIDQATKIVRALKAGKANITVTVGGKSATVTLTVTAPNKPTDFQNATCVTTETMFTTIVDIRPLWPTILFVSYVLHTDGTYDCFSNGALSSFGYYDVSYEGTTLKAVTLTGKKDANGVLTKSTYTISNDNDGLYMVKLPNDNGDLHDYSTGSLFDSQKLLSNSTATLTFNTDGTYNGANDSGVYYVQTVNEKSYVVTYSSTSDAVLIWDLTTGSDGKISIAISTLTYSES